MGKSAEVILFSRAAISGLICQFSPPLTLTVIHVLRPKVGEPLALRLTDDVATALVSDLRR